MVAIASDVSNANIGKEEACGIKTRTIIWYLAFFGFAINFVITNNVPFAIINMVDPNFRSNESQLITEFIEQNISTPSEISNKINLIETTKYVSLEQKLLGLLSVSG